MDSENIVVTTLTLLFGVLIGMMSVASILYFAGLVSLDPDRNLTRTSQSATPGLDLLDAYQCRPSETKALIQGGLEDNFDRRGEEPVNSDRFFSYWGDFQDVVPDIRSYDADGLDKVFVDEFNLPVTTASGLMVMKLRSLASDNDDLFSMGSLFDENRSAPSMSHPVVKLGTESGWERDGLLYWAELSAMTFNQFTSESGPANMIEYLQNEEESAPVSVTVSDSTQVDFIGFAICLGPEIKKGTRFISTQLDLPLELVNLSCENRRDQIKCDTYRGDLLCNASRPLACFKPGDQARPPDLDENLAQNSWSGGYLQISEPVAGNSFDTADDGHAFCQATFGEDWRMLTIHDGGPARQVIATGKVASGTEVWVDVPSEPHANCWTQRPDYNY